MSQKNTSAHLSTSPATDRPTGRLVRRGPSPMALEQRFMFDGAALVEVAAVTDNATSDSAIEHASVLPLATLARPSADSTAQAPNASSTESNDAGTQDLDPEGSAGGELQSPSTHDNFVLAAGQAADNEVLNQALASAEARLIDFSRQPDAPQQLFSLFSGDQTSPSQAWTNAAQGLLNQMSLGQVGLKVELISATDMPEAFGAYAQGQESQSGVVYLNADWVASAGTSSSAIERVLLEEFGHNIDATLNPATDTLGDEGQRFAATLFGDETSAPGFASDNDHQILTIGSERIAVELATNTFDVAGAPLIFDGATATILQSGTSVGAKYLYKDVFDASGTKIDAIVTLTSLSTSTTLSAFDSTSNPYSTTLSGAPSAPSAYFQPNLTIGSGGGYGTFHFQFILGGSYNATTAPSGTAVTLRNVYINTYDLDGAGASTSGRQYTDFTGIGGYTLSSSTSVVASDQGSGVTRFITTVGGNLTALPGTTAGDNIRARVNYTELSSIDIKMGDATASGLAYYGIDFSQGPTFTNAASAGVSITTTGPVVTTEGGGTGTFNVKLTSAPTANVTVTLTGLDTTEGSLSTTTLTFTSTNWNTPQTVTVTGVDDAPVDGDIGYTLTATSSSTDFAYSGRTAVVDVTNLDNDVASTPAVIGGDAAGAVTEDAASPTLSDTGTLTITDPDAGEASFQTTGITSAPGTLGSLSITSAGVWTYTVPNASVQYLKAGETRTETFTVHATDGTSHNVVVVVTGVNDAAVIGGDAAGAVTEDAASTNLSDTGTLTISDADTGEASFQTTGITASAGALGSLSITSAGVWTYTVPNASVQYLKAGETRTETFTVHATDGTSHNVVVVVTGVNDAAVIGGDAAGAVTEDAASTNLSDTGTLTISDADTGEASFQTTGITSAPGTLGSLSITSAGVWTYTVPNASVQYLAAGETKTETFTVHAADGTSHNVVVVITGVNDAPVPGDVTDPSWNSTDGRYEVSTPEDTPKTGTIAAGDPNSDTLSFAEQTAPTHGSITLGPATGDWTYTPDANYVGPDSFVVTVDDGHGGTANVTVLVTVTPGNAAAIIGGDADGAVTEDAASPNLSDTGTLTITDPDAGEASFQTTGITSAPGTLGSLSITSAGVWTYTVPNADVQYLAAGQTRTETFTVLAIDGTTHDVVITITGVNDVAVIGGDAAGAVTEDAASPNLSDTGTLTITDPDAGEASFQTTGITSAPGTLGSLSITNAGVWTYTVPNADVQYLAAGQTRTETFTVLATDGTSHDVVVTITGVNDTAVIGGDAAGAVTEDAASPTLSDSGTLTIADADTGEASFQTTGITSAPGTLGSLSITSAGVWTYTVPNADVQYLKAGETKTETFTVLAADGTTHDVVITITGVNDAAVIGGDAAGAVTEDAASPNLSDSGTLTVSDADTGEASFQTTGITASAGALGSLSITSAGVWTYTVPNADVQYLAAGQTRTETFTVLATDGTSHDVVVTITGVNETPVPGDVTDPTWNASSGRYEIATPEDTPKTGTIAASDLDADTLSFTAQTGPAHGAVTLNATTGDWTYTPDADYVGNDSFVVTADDGHGGTVNVTVLVTVTPTNDVPVPGNVTDPTWNASSGRYEISTPEDTPKTGTIAAGDPDADTLSFTEQTGPAHGAVTLNATTGDWTYTPDADYVGNDSFVVTVDDGHGGTVNVTVLVTVTPTNDAPVPGDVTDPTWNASSGRYEISTPEDTPKSGTIAAGDPDSDTLSFTAQTAPTHGSITLDPATGDWTYTPDADYVGNDSFVVTVDDGHGGTVNVTVLVTVTPTNDAPVPGDVTDPTWNASSGRYEISTPEDTPKTGTIVAGDPDADTLSFTEQTGPAHGAVTLNASTGAWTYTPNRDFNGNDSFVVLVSDGHGGTTAVTVVVEVTPVDDPVAVPPTPLTPALVQAAPPPLAVEDAAPRAGLRFDSTTFTAAPLNAMPTLSAEVLALIRPALDRSPEVSVLTRANGFQILVSPIGSGELMLNRGITDQFVDRTAVSSFVLPYDTFTHARPDATILLTARLADGRALPAWIDFDARSGTFRSAPPSGLEGEFVIEVTARDEKGNEVKTQFKLSVGHKAGAGRIGLSEQLKQEARRSLAWQDSVRAVHEASVAGARTHTAPIAQKAGA